MTGDVWNNYVCTLLCVILMLFIIVVNYLGLLNKSSVSLNKMVSLFYDS